MRLRNSGTHLDRVVACKMEDRGGAEPVAQVDAVRDLSEVGDDAAAHAVGCMLVDDAGDVLLLAADELELHLVVRAREEKKSVSLDLVRVVRVDRHLVRHGVADVRDLPHCTALLIRDDVDSAADLLDLVLERTEFAEPHPTFCCMGLRKLRDEVVILLRLLPVLLLVLICLLPDLLRVLICLLPDLLRVLLCLLAKTVIEQLDLLRVLLCLLAKTVIEQLDLLRVLLCLLFCLLPDLLRVSLCLLAKKVVELLDLLRVLLCLLSCLLSKKVIELLDLLYVLRGVAVLVRHVGLVCLFEK